MAVRTRTLPNLLTVFRIAVVPAFVVVLVLGEERLGLRLLAVGLFVVAAATDKVDGWLARRWNQVTDLGKILDPIADKLLMGAALVTLSVLGELWWWVTVVILVREVGITVLRFVLLRYVVLPASSGGKLKTVLQSGAIGLFLLPLWALPTFVTWLAWVTMAAALVVTVATGVDYLRTAAQIRRSQSRRG